MLDRDLATVYDVSTTRLNEQVSRNLRRFPETFCFYLTKDELKFWISQNATSKAVNKGIHWSRVRGFLTIQVFILFNCLVMDFLGPI